MSQSAAPDGWQPLSGIVVLDFSLLLPGPYATLALADLGADVIKVEAPAGDMVRQMPLPMFRMSNRNKRGIALDLKHPSAPVVLARLAARADVVIEGFRPGVAARLGIDRDTLAAHNPRLVHCSLSGYGQTGPERDAPGHELNYLAAAGAFALPGHWGEKPRRLGIPMIDLSGGCFAAVAILAALRERQSTGRGVYLDLSLHEVAMSYATVRNGLDLDHVARDHLWPTNDVFETADGGMIALGIVEEHFWRNFVAAVGEDAPDLADERYADDAGRRRHGDALSRRLHEILAGRTTAEWTARFESRDVPAQRVLTPAEATRTAQAVERETVMERDGERHLPFPVRVDGRRGAVLHRLAPGIGEHNRAVLDEVGFAADEIEAFEAAGLFGAAEDRKGGDG